MNRLARISLGLLGLALVAPTTAGAQDAMPTAPAGYQAAAANAEVGLDGQRHPAPSGALVPPALAPAPAQPAPAPHKHKGRTLCTKCASAEQARMAPPARIVGCAHSRNGVCTACAAALAMPGEVVMMGSGSQPEAPGRAVASAGPSPSASASHLASRKAKGTASAPYDGPSGEPMPVGVMQANYSQGPPMGMPGMMGAQPSQPGRAVAESGAGPAPYLPKTGAFPHPHILGHLFGWSGIGAEREEQKRLRKAEAHASIHYNNEGTTVNELPASAVYGRR